LKKFKEMKENCGDTPLAVASGITPENVDQFLPYVDCFMVSTGISKSFHDLDPVKTHQLATLINA
jgi:predicted TIM-barrel enzyme